MPKGDFSALVAPATSERIAQKAPVVVLIHVKAGELKSGPVVPHDLMSSAMLDKGTGTCMSFRQLVDALAAGEDGESPSWIGSHKDLDLDEIPGTAPPKSAKPASPRSVQEPSGGDTRSRDSSYGIFESRRDFAG